MVTEITYPALYRAADATSLRGQSRFLRVTKARLLLLVVAGLSGASAWHINANPTDWLAVLGAFSFAAAVLLEVWQLSSKFDQVWYDGRAIAESVKTLAWRYVTGGNPFGMDQLTQKCDQVFLERLDEIVEEVQRSGLVAPADGIDQITPEMRRMRDTDLRTRKGYYLEGRIDAQRAWYCREASWNERRATAWSVGVLFAETLGVVAALLRAVGVLRIDLLGVFGALVAAAIAWTQTKQHSKLARAYTVASQELAVIASRISSFESEAEWGNFVDQSEAAISREHTLWRASHT